MYGILRVRVLDIPAFWLFGLRMQSRPDDIPAALARLRATDGILSAPPARARQPFSLWPAGLPASALVNFFGLPGCGKTEAALRFAAETAPDARLCWIEASLTAYPPAFAQAGLRLSKILFVQAKDRLADSALQVLRSQLFALCVMAVECRELSGRDLRRLQLQAERSGGRVLLLSEIPLKAFSVSLRLRATREEGSVVLREVERAAKAAGA